MRRFLILPSLLALLGVSVLYVAADPPKDESLPAHNQNWWEDTSLPPLSKANPYDPDSITEQGIDPKKVLDLATKLRDLGPRIPMQIVEGGSWDQVLGSWHNKAHGKNSQYHRTGGLWWDKTFSHPPEIVWFHFWYKAKIVNKGSVLYGKLGRQNWGFALYQEGKPLQVYYQPTDWPAKSGPQSLSYRRRWPMS